MPEGGFAPITETIEVATIRIYQRHLVRSEVNNLVGSRNVATRVYLKRPEDGFCIQHAYSPCRRIARIIVAYSVIACTDVVAILIVTV